MTANRKYKMLATILAAIAAWGAGMAGATDVPTLVNGIRVDGAEPGEWTHDWDAATTAAKEKGMPVFVNFTGSDWCPWCKILERQVFSQQEWSSWARRNVYLVRLDFPKDEKRVPEKYRGRNRELARRRLVTYTWGNVSGIDRAATGSEVTRRAICSTPPP